MLYNIFSLGNAVNAGKLAIAGSFCRNRYRPEYGKVNHENIVRYGRTSKGTQRLKCKTCDRVFAECQAEAAHPDASIGACKALPRI